LRQIHRDYSAPAADIVETNTFTATTIAQADYGLEALVRDRTTAAARLAREIAGAGRWRSAYSRASSPAHSARLTATGVDLAGRQRPGLRATSTSTQLRRRPTPSRSRR
jgi:S-methylmethionine-dependent homocysteine/selenocysteine methylase